VMRLRPQLESVDATVRGALYWSLSSFQSMESKFRGGEATSVVFGLSRILPLKFEYCSTLRYFGLQIDFHDRSQ